MSRRPTHSNLENPLDLIRLEEPYTALSPLKGLVVIDEVQRRPDVFPVLRVLADRAGSSTHFLILGSASGDLLRQSSESLAGRIEKVCIAGFTLDETGEDELMNLWLRGGLPLSFTAGNLDDSLHCLLGLATMRDLLTSPWVGASWEGFALEQVLALIPHDRAFYWSTHQGAEMDLLLQRGTELYGVEIKRVDAPRISKSMRIPRDDFNLEGVIVVYPGDKTFSIGEGVTAVPLKALATPEAIRKLGR